MAITGQAGFLNMSIPPQRRMRMLPSNQLPLCHRLERTRIEALRREVPAQTSGRCFAKATTQLCTGDAADLARPPSGRRFPRHRHMVGGLERAARVFVAFGYDDRRRVRSARRPYHASGMATVARACCTAPSRGTWALARSARLAG